MKILHSLEISENNKPLTQLHIQEDLNPTLFFFFAYEFLLFCNVVVDFCLLVFSTVNELVLQLFPLYTYMI